MSSIDVIMNIESCRTACVDAMKARAPEGETKEFLFDSSIMDEVCEILQRYGMIENEEELGEVKKDVEAAKEAYPNGMTHSDVWAFVHAITEHAANTNDDECDIVYMSSD